VGGSPRTPSVVSRACEPKPTSLARANLLSSTLARAPVRLLSARAPRQAVLRASFRLAPFLRPATRTCDLPADKTRDASDRLLPPKRTTCTRTSHVPGYAAATFAAWAPHGVWAPCGLTGETSVFTTLEPLRRMVRTRCLSGEGFPSFGASRPAVFAAEDSRRERGRFLPTEPSTHRASDIPVASPSFARDAFGLRRRVLLIARGT